MMTNDTIRVSRKDLRRELMAILPVVYGVDRAHLRALESVNGLVAAAAEAQKQPKYCRVLDYYTEYHINRCDECQSYAESDA